MAVKRIALPSLMVCYLFLPLSAQAKGWGVEIELYLLGTTIEGDAGLGRAQGLPVELDFKTILENLDLAGMFHMEAIHESDWGTALDYSFMDLGYDLSGPYGGVAEAGVRQGVLQADLLYRRPMGKGSIDYLAGIRWWDNDFDVQIDTVALPGPVSADRKEDWVDIFVGARWVAPLSDSWDFLLRGDVGGFGLEADFTAQLYGKVRYAMTDNWALDLGYKAVWVDYETGTKGQRDYFAYDTVTHGPQLGIVYKF